MIVLLNQSLQSVDYGHVAGDLVKCDDADGKRLIEAGCGREPAKDEFTKDQIGKARPLHGDKPKANAENE